MRNIKPVLVLLTLWLSTQVFGQSSVSKIAFGSCANQSSRLPIYDVVVKNEPDLFVLLGDNIYGDTENMDTLRAIYQRMGAKPTFQNLKRNVPIIATWDDHDYGQNDAGRHFPYKEQSKQVFLEFFNEPLHTERRKHAGIYTSYEYDSNGKRLQVILLDVRTFRDNLLPYDGHKKGDRRYHYRMSYAPYKTADSTLLGEEQWKWLEEELKKPADVRIIGSGSQFGIEYNGYEAWANFPHEQKRMLELIKSTKANGVIFITGDVHYAEISKVDYPGLYPIYDITASGLSSTWEFATPNANRLCGPVMQNHFGMITINWAMQDPEIRMEVRDKKDKQCICYTIKLSDISFKP